MLFKVILLNIPFRMEKDTMAQELLGNLLE